MFANDNKKITILMSLALNLPIIRDLGCEPSKLLVLNVREGQFKKVMELFSDKRIPKLDALMSKKQLRNVLSENISFVIYPYTPSKKNDDFISELEKIVKVGTIMGDEVMACPIVVTEGEIQGFINMNMFSVYLDFDSELLPVQEREVVPPDNQLSVVLDKISNVITLESGTEERALLSAVCFLYPNLIKKASTEAFEDWLGVAREMIRQDEDNKAVKNIASLFIGELCRWQEKVNFSEVYELPNLEMKNAEKMDCAFFYDGDFIYMKEKLFKCIAERLFLVFSVDVVKRELVKADVICVDMTSTYTVKMTYLDIAGQFHRERMLRFNRGKFTLLGEMEFIELCEERKERNNAGSRKV